MTNMAVLYLPWQLPNSYDESLSEIRDTTLIKRLRLSDG